MPRKNQSKKGSRKRRQLQQDRVGDLYDEISDETGQARLRISFKRNWYSPPFTKEGEVDLERAQEELSEELTGSTIVLASYLENGELGYRTEIAVGSKDELEHLLRTIRKLYVDGLKHDNAVRKAALEACESKIAEADTPSPETEQSFVDRRKEADRRTSQRRGHEPLGGVGVGQDDRRMEEDRRDGKDRRAA